jgi:type II secretory pathway component PulK
MRTIAVMTMLFLPATYCAALFATPAFQWEKDQKLRNHSQIWIYWVCSVATTMVVFCA